MDTGDSFYSLAEAANLIGVSYDRAWYAVMTGKVPAPLRVGRTRLLTPDDIERLRLHFGPIRSPVQGDGGDHRPGTSGEG